MQSPSRRRKLCQPNGYHCASRFSVIAMAIVAITSSTMAFSTTNLPTISPKGELRGENPPKHFREKIANSIAKGERRALERSHQELRKVCGGCGRPFNLCICEVLNQWNNGTESISEAMIHSELIVLQHPNEFRKKHTSTVPLLRLLLGEKNVKIKVGYEFTLEDINGNDNGKERPIMLFPGPDAIDLDLLVASRQAEADETPQELSQSFVPNTPNKDSKTDLLKTRQKKYTLVLIDGTWAEAKRIIRKSPEVLEGCQMVQFAFEDSFGEEDTNPIGHSESSWPMRPESYSDQVTKSRSIYHAMRREPEEHCLSTLEACGQALRTLEGKVNGPKLQKALNSVLSRHVELHLKNAREASQSRRNGDTSSRDARVKRSKEIEDAIYGDPSEETRSTMISNAAVRSLAINSHTTVSIRRLTHEDIPVIDEWWENGGSSKSIMTIERSIDADYRLGIGASLGIVEDTTAALVACILRYESGPLGILHVSEKFRGKGYGTALLKESTKILSEANLAMGIPSECEAFIKDGNTASERVFTKVGYVRENPNAKRGTGKRRANRKWIYHAQQSVST